MGEIRAIDLGEPALLEFSGPDAARFLNGQMTQDVRRVAGGKMSVPSCLTDAKGKLQFRVWITENDAGHLWVAGAAGSAETLEARLTRYLIADEVEVADLTGKFALVHLLGDVPPPPPGVMARQAERVGEPGTDWWLPAGVGFVIPEGGRTMAADELEALRISRGIPAWGRELTEGMLPPEALLEATDISYQKGCYIGQEVISRIKSAGKVNRRLSRLVIDASVELVSGPLEDGAGEVTSVSPLAEDGNRHALGYLKRNAEEPRYRAPDGTVHAVRVI